MLKFRRAACTDGGANSVITPTTAVCIRAHVSGDTFTGV
jgi:hypothetical protein